jgi:hypothetical protein
MIVLENRAIFGTVVGQKLSFKYLYEEEHQ